MLQSVKELRGMAIQATDGEIGKVYDFYFDDEAWTLRYLAVETGSWFFGKRVLISPVALGRPDLDEVRLPVNLNREQVKNSPDVEMQDGISRQNEVELHHYYGWPMYFGGGTLADDQESAGAESSEFGDGSVAVETKPSVVRSLRSIVGYHIQAIDGQMGHVHDFLIDDEQWEIRYMVVDTKNWWGGKIVLVLPEWIAGVNWEEHKVDVDLTKESIQNSPETENLTLNSKEYEERFLDYYKRRKFWR